MVRAPREFGKRAEGCLAWSEGYLSRLSLHGSP